MSGFLIITRGKTACIDDAHYSKYPCFCVSGWWMLDGGWYASETAVNCRVVNPHRHTSSQHCAHNSSTVTPTWTAFSISSQCDSFMFAWQQCLLFFWLAERAGMTVLPLAHEYKPLMASHAAGVSESVDQTPASIKLQVCSCISVCEETHTPNYCSSCVTVDKISMHWFCTPWHWLKGESCTDIIVLSLWSCWIGYEPADGSKQWMTNMTYTTQTELTM